MDNKKNINKPQSVKIVSMFYVVTTSIFFISLPFLLLTAKKAAGHISFQSIVFGIVPVAILNIITFVAAICLMRRINWSRFALIILSGIHAFIHLRNLLFSKMPNNPQAFLLVYLIFTVYAIWALRRKQVVEWLSKK